MANLLPSSYKLAFGGIFAVLVEWAVFSAAISAVLVVTDWVLKAVSGASVDITDFSLSYVRSLQQFQYLDYYQYLWVGLIIVISGASILYIVSVAQAQEGELIGDFFSDVAARAVEIMGLALIIWVVGFWTYALFLSKYGIMNTNQSLTSILNEGASGLQALGISGPYNDLMWVFSTFYAYIPAPIYFFIYVYVLRNAHTGWMGNEYTQEVSP